jgi:hypothetical protein
MDVVAAIKLVDELLAKLNLTRADHQVVLDAIRIIQAAVRAVEDRPAKA